MTGLITTAQDCVSIELLRRNAARDPDKVVLKFDSGETFTNASLLSTVEQQAAALQALGVRQGDYVLSWLPNGPRAVLLLLALNTAGAIYVPINIAYKGGLLAHVIASAGASLMIADGRLLERLHDIDTAALDRIVVCGPERPALNGVQLLDEQCLDVQAPLQALPRPIDVTDTHIVIFTSGTTGPSKGVLGSYLHTATAAREFRHVGPEDCSLVSLPMFHIGGVLGVFFALVHGGSSAFVQGFSTSRFWPLVRELAVTTVGLLGAMVQFLMQQPVTPGERYHPVKTAVIAPLGDDALAFAERFGVDVYTEFNMTELSVPLFCGPNPAVRGTCGTPRAGVELRLVDDNGDDVAIGGVGELLVKVENPFAISHGYLNNPEATAKAFRDGWFHTGDLFRRDADDNYFFVDRAKDMIRRRGENISSFEVEAEVLAYPGVQDAAAVAVAGDGGEDEVMVVVCPVQGATIDPGELLGFLQPRMAHFMLPRYIRVIEALPRTPTQKVEKHLLRSAGITHDTWDREAAGIVIRRQKLNERRNTE